VGVALFQTFFLLAVLVDLDPEATMDSASFPLFKHLIVVNYPIVQQLLPDFLFQYLKLLIYFLRYLHFIIAN
jgi:hypothetical protein